MATTKELIVDKAYNSNLYVLKFVGGGEVPDELKGGYTSKMLAEQARKDYYTRKSAASTKAKKESLAKNPTEKAQAASK